MKIRITLILLIASLSFTSFSNSSMAQKLEIRTSPEEVGKRIFSNIVDRRFGWRYQKVCTYYGALIFADETKNKNITAQIEDGYTPFLKGKRKPHKGHVDYNVFGIWPLEMYRQTGKEEYFKMGKWLAVDELQKPNGMFHHRADAPFYWGRGNGWAAAAFTEILLVLPENHEHYPALLDAFQKMMKTVATYQGKDGMWHQLIDDEESFAESSCSGMFLYALASAVDNGWLPYDEYKTQVERGWDALAGYVNDKGEAIDVCVGTNAKPRKKHYLTRPRSTGNFHGQAAVLWAATAMQRLLDK